MAPDWAATARGWARPAKAAVPAMTVLRESCGLIAAPGGVSPDLPRPEPTGRTPWPPEALALRTAGVTGRPLRPAAHGGRKSDLSLAGAPAWRREPHDPVAPWAHWRRGPA